MDQNKWKQLYELINEFIKMKPWEYLWGEELIWINDQQENKDYYCSIMGMAKECIGLSIYQDEQGLQDAFSLMQPYPCEACIKYVMYDQTCLTFYLGEKDEVPEEQMEMIEKLKFKFKNGQYPYFLSFKPHFFPSAINNNDVDILIKIIDHLIKTVNALIEGKIDVELDNEELIYTKLHTSEYSAIAQPEFIDKYKPIILYDDYLNEIKYTKRTEQSYIFDLAYLDMWIDDEEFELPINPLLFTIYNETTDQIYCAHLLHPSDDEIEVLISGLSALIETEGIPENIYIRIPKVYQALAHMASYFNINIEYMDMEFLDEMQAQMVEMMEM